ncbi:hypothetical protein [Azospirillum canadense]|uniref:hypothetical protein n=1 Tax=Azospirillum canadense TaxID=403962 RepID=UPI0022263667|nr:hypothetical protein [Azospirillum canadense]MCW2241492.1 hypothetical protein [Azospirillum canadense]
MLTADRYIVEVNQEATGILARSDKEFQFFVSQPAAFALNQWMFPSARDAIDAVARTIAASCR